VFTTRYVLHSTFCPHSIFMCFVWIWEQTAIISLYSVNWLVLITETECVYCAVRSTFYVLPTQYIYVFCVDLRTNSDYFTVQLWLVGVYNRDGLCLLRGMFYVFICILYRSLKGPYQVAQHSLSTQTSLQWTCFCVRHFPASYLASNIGCDYSFILRQSLHAMPVYDVESVYSHFQSHLPVIANFPAILMR
jgi:hypothetical protein